MATPRKWSNVAIAMQSVLAAAKTVTAVVKGTTATVSSTAHGFTNGDYVLMTAVGMYQINGRVFRVSASSANDFVLEGEDTTSYDTFTSGSAQKITFGTSVTTATTVNASGGTFGFIDTTTIHQAIKTQMPGVADAATYTFDNIWDPSDPGLVAMKSASDQAQLRAFKFTFGLGGPVMVFYSYVAATLLPGGSAQDKVTTSSVLTMSSLPTYYGS